MRSGFRIGKLFGVDIRVDWSWLFILAFVTWNLSVAFGQFHPEWGLAMQWGMGLVASLVFFASVLAHELAHSLVAKSKGIPVHDITLFLFGGVSNIRDEPGSPAAEFLMAIAGPLTSVILGIVLVAVAWLSTNGFAGVDRANPLGQLGPVSTLLLWLGSINVTLGIFNLIPGFPLDGGRVLRSILWALTRNLRRATRWATWIGRGIAWTMIIGGVSMAFGIEIPLLGTGLISGLWLAFIGWFLNSAASQGYERVIIQDILEGVSAEQMMRSSPPTVPADISISALVYDHIIGEDECGFPVMENDQLVGIVTLEDVRGVPHDAWEGTLVREVMTPAKELVTVTAEEDASSMVDKMIERDVRQLPVMRDGQMAGCVRRQDVIRWLELRSGRP